MMPVQPSSPHRPVALFAKRGGQIEGSTNAAHAAPLAPSTAEAAVFLPRKAPRKANAFAKVFKPKAKRVPISIVIPDENNSNIGMPNHPPAMLSASAEKRATFVPVTPHDENLGLMCPQSEPPCYPHAMITPPPLPHPHSHSHSHSSLHLYSSSYVKHSLASSPSQFSATSRTSDMTEITGCTAFSPYMMSPSASVMMSPQARSPLPVMPAQRQYHHKQKPKQCQPHQKPRGKSPSMSYSQATRRSPQTKPNALSSPSPASTRRSAPSPSPHSASRTSPGSPFSPASVGSSSVNNFVQQQQHQDDAARKQKLKTELCVHFVRNNRCPFGDNCNYAHGEGELKMRKLTELSRAGLIDVETYRTKPCMTWVATGSCPFGKRCTSIHDPRVAGRVPSWLPHTETQGNNIGTDINVDGLHQRRLGEALHNNPFGDQFSMDLDTLTDLYKMVCNTAIIKRRRNAVSEMHKISIALQMRGEPGWMYKFRPKHVIGDMPCMVLQKRVFHLAKSGSATPISMGSYDSKRSDHTLVREIAFGPDADPSVRGVSLWFNIADSEVSTCGPQQARRFRWKRLPKGSDNMRRSPTKGLIFDNREYFVMVRSLDKTAFEFTTKILQHRFDTFKAERLSVAKDRSQAIRAAKKRREELEVEFGSLQQSWKAWGWPMNTGRQTVDDDTPVPSVQDKYIPLMDVTDDGSQSDAKEGTEGDPDEAGQSSDQSMYGKEGPAVLGAYTCAIWNSFVDTHSHGRKKTLRVASSKRASHSRSYAAAAKTKPNELDLFDDAAMPHTENKRRLSIFRQLSQGISVSSKTNRPIDGLDQPTRAVAVNPIVEQRSERCWNALLAPLAKEDEAFAKTEWDLVRAHFQKSKSNKVLAILQQ